MADNITITQGSGTTIATDDVGGVQYQRVKLVDATDGSSTAAGVAANPLQVSLANTAANSTAVKVDGSAVTQPVSGTVTVTGTVTANVGTGVGSSTIADGSSTSIKASVLDYTNSNPLAVRLTDTSGDYVAAGAGTQYANGDAVATPTGTAVLGFDGANVRAVATDSSGNIQVDVLTAPTTTVTATNLDIRDLTSASDSVAAVQSGTWNIGTVTAVTAISNALPAGTNNIGDVDVLTLPGIVGTVADDSTTPGNPVMIGGSAKETDGTDPGSVSAEDDVTRVITDRNRRMLVNTVHPNLWTTNENHASAQTNNELKAAPGANLSLYVTDIIISNGATAGSVQLVRDTAGTPVTIAGPYYFAINGGAVINLKTPIRLPANINLGFTSTSVTTHSVTVNGYTAP